MIPSEGQRVVRLGPGLRAALAVLGPEGQRIARAWSSLDAESLAEMERSLPWAARRGVGDLRRGEGRWGLACALLRRAAAEGVYEDRGMGAPPVVKAGNQGQDARAAARRREDTAADGGHRGTNKKPFRCCT
jgi:hypothetical protein